MKLKQSGRTVIYQSPWIELYRDRAVYPDGQAIEAYHVLHYPSASVVCFVENERGEILMIRSDRYVIQQVG